MTYDAAMSWCVNKYTGLLADMLLKYVNYTPIPD